MAKENVIKLTPVSVLKRLIAKSNTARDKSATINGEYGSDVAKAVDEHNLHKGAFGTINKLQRMDSVKLMAWLTHFDDYRAKLEIDKLAAPDLPGVDGKPEEETEPSKVVPIGGKPAAALN